MRFNVPGKIWHGLTLYSKFIRPIMPVGMFVAIY